MGIDNILIESVNYIERVNNLKLINDFINEVNSIMSKSSYYKKYELCLIGNNGQLEVCIDRIIN